MNIEVFAGYVALVTTLIGLLPQIWKAYITKSTSDIAMLMLVNYLICSIAWIIHGFYQVSYFVVISNVIGLIMSIISIMQKYYYDTRKS